MIYNINSHKAVLFGIRTYKDQPSVEEAWNKVKPRIEKKYNAGYHQEEKTPPGLLKMLSYLGGMGLAMFGLIRCSNPIYAGLADRDRDRTEKLFKISKEAGKEPFVIIPPKTPVYRQEPQAVIPLPLPEAIKPSPLPEKIPGTSSTSPDVANICQSQLEEAKNKSDTTSVVDAELLEACQKALPSIVKIEVDIGKKRPEIGSGSVIAVNKETQKSYVITASHVIAKQVGTIRLKSYNGEYLEGKVIDTQGKISLIEMDGIRDNMKPLTLARETDYQNGDIVFTIGTPYGQPNVFTFGTIINTSKRINAKLLVNPGNSGGPAYIVKEGQVYVIGSVEGKLTPKPGNADPHITYIEPIKLFDFSQLGNIIQFSSGEQAQKPIETN